MAGLRIPSIYLILGASVLYPAFPTHLLSPLNDFLEGNLPWHLKPSSSWGGSHWAGTSEKVASNEVIEGTTLGLIKGILGV